MLKPVRVLYASFLMFTVFVCCSRHKNITSCESSGRLSYKEMFQNAVIDAMVAEKDEICGHLTRIVESNTALSGSDKGGEKRVLMATWTRLGYAYDWGGPYDEIGISECVIKKDSKVIGKSNEPTIIYISGHGRSCRSMRSTTG